MLRIIFSYSLVFFLFLISGFASAGIIIGGTRLVYISDQSDATINVKNKETKLPYLVQVWVDPFDENDKSKPPFTAIPPVSRLEARQEKVLRIIKTKGALPEDRESVFWLNIKNIPPMGDNANTNTLEIAIKTRIKLFWRPASIKLVPESAALKMKWSVQGKNLIVSNPTPLHINVMSVTVDGKDVPLNMVPPFDKVTLPLPAGVTGKALTWRFINDYGAISQNINVTL